MRMVEPLLLMAFWSALTIGFYAFAKTVYRRFPTPVTSPLLLTPIALIFTALALHASYAQYIHATHWLVLLLGPATVAFAVPIYEERRTIRRYWPVLAFGVVVGSVTAMASAWALASLLSLNGSLRLSLLPRSISTPFAMTISEHIGGVPDLTAVFVVITGVSGAVLGELLLRVLPLRSALARGALFGMGAHGAGVAKAQQIGREEGSIAGLVMVFVGLVNVFAAPLLQAVLS
ncbi:MULTISPECIES: LrgB family protein [Alphaproteobacteria]|uniref:Murein hydrolase effector protein LrgB n=2 Tax=Alphaproteobacteria TaxID=28211 RepID=A0A512HPS3_9HYPH|nr:MULTISPECIES: LrgB family protein [Alphaproteobacteria]GEO87458.1 murein hydrolase effector protein LrgB [Ciceribacter naphthalenivorans]GLR23416.1 murein hydrolase effector protein LrgB [Ciceribacter naphthalenivorans]GLT06272.1 murein hydrolase effector protein LrgB [Sphingomonas psychrolutea]